MTDLPDELFASEDGAWNADPVEPCMCQYVRGDVAHARRAGLEAKVSRLESRGIEDMQHRIAELEAELAEQVRLHDAGGSREHKLRTELAAVTRERDAIQSAVSSFVELQDAWESAMDSRDADDADWSSDAMPAAIDELRRLVNGPERTPTNHGS